MYLRQASSWFGSHVVMGVPPVAVLCFVCARCQSPSARACIAARAHLRQDVPLHELPVPVAEEEDLLDDAEEQGGAVGVRLERGVHGAIGDLGLQVAEEALDGLRAVLAEVQQVLGELVLRQVSVFFRTRPHCHVCSPAGSTPSRRRRCRPWG